MSKLSHSGIFLNLPFEKYQKLAGINQSTLKRFHENEILKRKIHFNLRALQFGSAGHCLLLEPENFEHLYICAPKNLNQRKKTGKERWKEFSKLHKGKIILTHDDWNRLQNIRKSFQIHPEIQKLFSNGVSEVSLFWKDLEYGLNCKARLDWFDRNSNKILDIKFTENISKVHKLKTIKNKFALQAKWYTRGVYQLTNIVSDFFFIFIEKFSPHFIQIVNISENDLKIGQEQIDYIINYYIQKQHS